MIIEAGERTRTRPLEILEPAVPGDRLSRAFDVGMTLLIVSSVVAAILWSVGSVASRYGRFFDVFEVVTVMIFTAEYLARLWTCTGLGSARLRHPVFGRLRWAVSMNGIIDLLAVLPFFVTLLIRVDAEVAHVLPLLRVLKLMRYSPALETLGAVFYTERRTLAAAATIMLVLLLFSSCLIYLVERDAQPEVFTSIPDAMWWGIATLTTVGYGDVTPITPLGKFLGSIVTVLGIGMFALPAGILATGFSQEIKHREFLTTWNLVASVPMFAGLKAAEIARIARLLEPLVVQAGQLVVRRGDRAESMFFVVSGDLEVDFGDERIPFEGEFFGEIAVLDKGSRLASIRALTRAQLLVLRGNDLEAFLDDNPELAQTIRQVARERLEHSARSRGRSSQRPAQGERGERDT